jgi:transposase-like protein
MPAPLLVISDGGKGLCTSIERSVPHNWHEHCTIHVAWKVLAKVPEHAAEEIERDYWSIFEHIEGDDDESARRRRGWLSHPVEVRRTSPCRAVIVQRAGTGTCPCRYREMAML